MVGQGGGRRGEKGRDLYFPEYTIFLFCNFFSLSQNLTHAQECYYHPSLKSEKPEALCKVKTLVENHGARKR